MNIAMSPVFKLTLRIAVIYALMLVWISHH